MPLPHRFVSGEIARSRQVNDNFNYIMDMLGQLSTTGRLTPPGEFVIGPRKMAILTGNHDTGAAANRFFQIGWNADWNPRGGAYHFDRVVSGPSNAIRIGARGLEVLMTDYVSGNLGSQMNTIFRTFIWNRRKYVYIPADSHITRINEAPKSLEDHRLTTVIFNTPKPVYNSTRVSKGVTTINAYNYGVPKDAKAIWIRAHVTADNYSGAGMLIYQDNANNRINKVKGMVAHATITGTGLGMRTGSFGYVPLGEGSHAGRVRIERTASFYVAVVHIVGYLL